MRWIRWSCASRPSDVYKRQVGAFVIGDHLFAAAGIAGNTGAAVKITRSGKAQLHQRPVSYTHLDVYKRQILPHVVANPVFGVFLAEPVSDIIAATVTATTFFLQFNKILDRGAGGV